MDTILIDQLEFYAYHGASDEEQAIGHRYAVDVEIGFDTSRAGETDDLTDTINYSRVAKRIVEIGTTQQFRLLEALAASMADAVMAEFPAQTLWLKVQKLHPPMPVIAKSVGVIIERERT